MRGENEPLSTLFLPSPALNTPFFVFVFWPWTKPRTSTRSLLFVIMACGELFRQDVLGICEGKGKGEALIHQYPLFVIPTLKVRSRLNSKKFVSHAVGAVAKGDVTILLRQRSCTRRRLRFCFRVFACAFLRLRLNFAFLFFCAWFWVSVSVCLCVFAFAVAFWDFASSVDFACAFAPL